MKFYMSQCSRDPLLTGMCPKAVYSTGASWRVHPAPATPGKVLLAGGAV